MEDRELARPNSRTSHGTILLPISGRTVSLLAFARWVPRVRLSFWPDVPSGPEHVLYIDGPIHGNITGEPVLIDPANGPSPALLTLLGKRIGQARALEDGGLEIEFADLDRAAVHAVRLMVGNGGFEPWQLCGDDGYRFVSLAGGGLARWNEEAPTSVGPS